MHIQDVWSHVLCMVVYLHLIIQFAYLTLTLQARSQRRVGPVRHHLPPKSGHVVFEVHFCHLVSGFSALVFAVHSCCNLVDNLRSLTLKLLSRDAKFYLHNAQFGKSIFRKTIKFVATRYQILRLKCTKFNFGWGSAPDPSGGAYSAFPDLLPRYKGIIPF